MRLLTFSAIKRKIRSTVWAILGGLITITTGSQPAHAQFLGQVSLQTIQANLATSLNCTGAAQNFSTASSTLNAAGFRNLGQVRHILTIASIVGATQFQAEIDGIDNQGNVYRISDVLELPGTSVTRQGSLMGTGNYTNIQVSVTCFPNTATFTASYQGDFGSAPSLPGSFLSAQIDHTNFTGIAGNVTQNDSFQTPFGNAAGTIYVQLGGGTATGATITVFCNTLANLGAQTAFTANIQSTTALQSFSVPPVSCPLAQVTYNPNGGGGTTVSVEYVFAVPGLNSSNNGSSLNPGTDPCLSPNSKKVSVAVNISTATTTQLVPLGTVNSITVCGGFVTVGSSGTSAATLKLESGTGASCGTGTLALTGTMGTGTATATNDGEPVVFPTSISLAPGTALCAVTAGTTVNVQGYLTYVQQ